MWYLEFDVVPIAKSRREHKGGGAVVTEPVSSSRVALISVHPDQCLVFVVVDASTGSHLIMMYPCLRTFMTVATQMVARLRGSTASSFIPALNCPGGCLKEHTVNFDHSRETRPVFWEHVRR